MAWLARPVTAFTYALDLRSAAARLSAKLQGRGVPSDADGLTDTPDASTTLIARCLTLCLNLGLWRCWSDKLEFRLESIGAHETRVTVNAIPNLLRTGLRPGERATDIESLVARLQSD
jgi:hypothetical protein